MPVVYKFRVTFVDHDDISRDIEIKSVQTFLDLHQIIQSSIGFDGAKPASFYMSNDHWIKGQEISSEKHPSKDGQTAILMQDARLADFIADPHQKIYYVSDPEANWCFFVELNKIIPQGDALKHYPVCVKTTGEAPKQYKVIPAPKATAPEDDEFDKLFAATVAAATDEEEAPEEMEEEIATEETGVELEELTGMGEEGEEDENKDEEEESEMGYMDEEGSEKDDY